MRTLLMLVSLALLVPTIAFADVAACPHDGCMARAEYVAMGASTLAGIFGSMYHCLDDDCSHGGTAIGGAQFALENRYTNAIFSLDDDVYGSSVANQVCAVGDDGDCVASGDAGCGMNVLLGSPEAFDTARVYVFLAHVGHDTTFCGGTTGTATASVF